jgi:N-methylhydantoinase B
MVPPIRLWDQGVPNQAALTIMTRNSRMPDSLAADLDAECSACLMGRAGSPSCSSATAARPSRPASTPSSTAPPRRSGREVLSKIPDGQWTWEDYAEHDGVDEPQLHTQRITLTKTADRLVIDFTGTSKQARGPSTTAATTPTATSSRSGSPRSCATSPTPRAHGRARRRRGRRPLIEMRFPEKGTLLTPVFPAPVNARTFVILRLLGVLAGVLAKAVDGRMPADQETIRYTGVYGTDDAGEPYLMREVLGGGSGGRYYADGEDTIHVVPDSGTCRRSSPSRASPSSSSASAGPRLRRGGAVPRRPRLREAHPDAARRVVHVDRRPLDPRLSGAYRGGRAGQPFQVTSRSGRTRPNARVDALADAEPVREPGRRSGSVRTAGRLGTRSPARSRAVVRGGGGWPINVRSSDALFGQDAQGRLRATAACGSSPARRRPGTLPR